MRGRIQKLMFHNKRENFGFVYETSCNIFTTLSGILNIGVRELVYYLSSRDLSDKFPNAHYLRDLC